ncbi:hypothetical protein GGI15_004210 [Coemansia interrupta]|uniref:Integral membrane bound transporter domain-containing protein n=1 Tax=Coemansia interrupta TaxID=1126814 RepID=A0A9W8H8C1_9FUNG|nr:hypothetical protein GGI15_004210 [Coemansia interrupta]
MNDFERSEQRRPPTVVRSETGSSSGGKRASIVFQHLHAASTFSGSPQLARQSVMEEDEEDNELSTASESTALLGSIGRAGGDRVHKWRLSSEQTAVAKAVVAYAVAALFTFVPQLREWLGDPEYMAPHLVTNAAIWFHAGKTRSGLVEGGALGVVWVCVTSVVTYTALVVGEWLHFRFVDEVGPGVVQPLAWQSKASSLGVFVFGFSWVLAFFKANAGRASVGTATAIANVALYLVMLREAPVVNYRDVEDGVGESVGRKAAHVLVAVLTGMALSFAVGWAVRPQTASAQLRAHVRATLASFGAILAQLPGPIVGGEAGAGAVAGQAKQHGAKSAALKGELRAQRQRLQELRTHVQAAALEPTEWGCWARRGDVAALAACMDALGLRLGALSCALELRSDAEGPGDVAAAVRAPVMALAHACQRALSAAETLVADALGSRRAGDERRCSLVRGDMAAALSAFEADYGRAVGTLAAAPDDGQAPGDDHRVLAVHFFVFGLRDFAGQIADALLPAVAAVCRPPPTVRATLRRELLDGARLRVHVRRLGGWLAAQLRVLCDTGATSALEARHEIGGSANPTALHNAARPSLGRGVWRVSMWLRRPNVRFATKYALLVTLLSLPWYWSIDAYWAARMRRLEWTVVSAAAIMAPTVGGSAVVSVYRVLGTCAGGLAAFLAFEAAAGCALVAYVLLVAVAAPCFHVMLRGRYPKIGQFALVTFGVVLVNRWVASEDQGEGAGDLALRRTLAVALGVAAGMLASAYVWPFEARVRLRQALSWWLLTAHVLVARQWSGDSADAAAAAAAELQLQGALVETRALLADTLNEPRLKGPFPVDAYQHVINACQRMLDAVVAARWVAAGEEAAVARIADAAAERQHRDALLALTMYVLASALVLKTPLPEVLPPIHGAQQGVAAALAGLLDPAEHADTAEDRRAAHARYVFYYTHVLLAGELVDELAIVARLMRALYGASYAGLLRASV